MRRIREPNGVFSWDGTFNVNVYGYDHTGKFYYVGTVDWDQATLRHYVETQNEDYTITNTGGHQWDIAMGRHLRTYVDSDSGQILVTQNTPGAEEMAAGHEF